jgi:hypothetical protein
VSPQGQDVDEAQHDETAERFYQNVP